MSAIVLKKSAMGARDVVGASGGLLHLAGTGCIGIGMILPYCAGSILRGFSAVAARINSSLALFGPHMAAFNATTEAVLENSPAVQRYKTSFVKRQVKFEPCVALTSADCA
jgi:hypothetical protein